mgnify:FL=1
MAYVPTLKTQYKEQIVAALMKEFGYSSVMQCPKLTKIVINQGMGQAVADKKLIDVAEAELTQITGQKAVQTRSRKDISNFKLRKGMPIGVRVTLRDEAVQSRSTTPTGMRSIWPEPKIVAMNRMQNNGNATHTPK